MRRLLAVVLSLSALIVPSTFAQSHGPLPPLTAHVDVNVVNVDVTVTDRSGKPVMNLTRGRTAAGDHELSADQQAFVGGGADVDRPAAAPPHHPARRQQLHREHSAQCGADGTGEATRHGERRRVRVVSGGDRSHAEHHPTVHESKAAHPRRDREGETDAHLSCPSRDGPFHSFRQTAEESGHG